eukprot:3452725-Lingulodinium_polyedra.AAC.2
MEIEEPVLVLLATHARDVVRPSSIQSKPAAAAGRTRRDERLRGKELVAESDGVKGRNQREQRAHGEGAQECGPHAPLKGNGVKPSLPLIVQARMQTHPVGTV